MHKKNVIFKLVEKDWLYIKLEIRKKKNWLYIIKIYGYTLPMSIAQLIETVYDVVGQCIIICMDRGSNLTPHFIR